jgi:hypothetical protein
MVGAIHHRADGYRSLQGRPGTGQVPKIAKDHAEVVDVDSDLWVVRAQGGLIDSQCRW